MNRIIKNVLYKLEMQGYSAYVVGGFVRDKFLKRKTYDIDICTSALPKEINEIFGKNLDNTYGCTSFKFGKYNFDITTYRKEIKYINRKPTEIMYIDSLEEDIIRRDFTMNSLCMDKNGKIYDYTNGKKDINKRIIKTIGDIDLKLKEDPLRILRAIRFASTLNFELDYELSKSIKENSELVKTLSVERIKSELSKILLSNNYIYGFKLLKDHKILNELDITFDKIINSSDLLVMYSQINISEKYFSKNENKQVKTIKNLINYGKIDEVAIYKYGLYISTVVGELFSLNKKDVNKIYKGMWINESNPLSITSEEIMNTLNIVPSKNLGLIKEELISLILDKKLQNNRKKIIEYLKKRK